MGKKPLSKKAIYILAFISTILLLIAYGFGNVFLHASIGQNRHGIGAAIIETLIFNGIMGIFALIYIIMIAEIIMSIQRYKKVPKTFIIVPFVPVIVAITLSNYGDVQKQKINNTYTAGDCVEEVNFTEWKGGKDDSKR